MTLTEYLAEVRALVEKATPGLVPVGKSEGIFIEDADGKHVALFSGTNLVNDSNFYEHARTDVPLLLAIIEEQAKA